MQELISIVVPVYNVEKYLKKCIQSIIQQTYKNIEIILVNDGSTDNCGKICEKYSKNDNRIIVIHKENGGLSDARNSGIKIARGKYIAFVDSDDYIDIQYIDKLYNSIIENNTKIAQCNILEIDDNENEIEKIGTNIKSIKNGKDMIKELYDNKWENTVAWNKLYLKELFNDYLYPIGKIHEDEFTTYKLLYLANEISIVPEFLYFYRQTNNSIMGKKFSIKRLDKLEAIEERLQFFYEKKESNLYNLTLQNYLQIIRENYLNVKLFIDNSKQIQKNLKIKYRKNYLKFIHIKEIKKSSKLKACLFFLFPNIWFVLKKGK